MKKLILLLFAALALALVCPSKVRADNITAAQQLIKTNTSTTVPVALSATSKPFRTATIIGNQTARTANTGNVYIGPTSTNDAQPYLVSPGDIITITAPDGAWYDLKDWYLDVATANDGVVVIYSDR